MLYGRKNKCTVSGGRSLALFVFVEKLKTSEGHAEERFRDRWLKNDL